MPMVLRAIDGRADVVEQRRVFEQLSLDATEAVNLLRGVEQLQCQRRDLLAVRRLRVELRREVENGAAPGGRQAPAVRYPTVFTTFFGCRSI